MAPLMYLRDTKVIISFTAVIGSPQLQQVPLIRRSETVPNAVHKGVQMEMQTEITRCDIRTVQGVVYSHSTQSQVQLAVWGSVTSITFDPLRTIWPWSDFQQTLTQSQPSPPRYWHLTKISSMPGEKYWCHSRANTKVGTLIVATIYLQLIQNRYMFRSFTVLQCSHQHCVQPIASDVEVVGYL